MPRSGGLTFSLKAEISCGVIVSALAITGIRLTLVPSRFIVSMSRGFNLVGVPQSAIKRLFLETTPGREHSRMSIRSDKVETGVHPHINFVSSVGLLFLTHKVLVLIIQEINDR